MNTFHIMKFILDFNGTVRGEGGERANGRSQRARGRSARRHARQDDQRERARGPVLCKKAQNSAAPAHIKMSASTNRDALREGPVRLLGYANEVGESFKPVVPHAAYLASYGIVGSYVLCDAAWRGTRPPLGQSGVVEALDTLLWQGLASVALPGFAINRVVWAVGHASIGRIAPGNLRTWLPTAAGLACIPFIVKPIDRGVDLLMGVVRPLYKKKG